LFLRSLQLLGFKTFARQTEIQFDGGVTAIVGPNGSGKTNIVDAVKWVLGSGHARDIRGRKMEEVIYAGGERRSRASFAEVTMVFDNTAGRLPVDYHEVAIKRRVERDGQSDFFLNGSRVRRRDLIHLLSSTGLTVDSYAIIDQHDIEHIVVCTPAERRQLLEEAAQVRGVKARRQEAVQRLQELAANLLRLEDLKTELAPRLEALRAQAAAAREAAEATARLELLRGSIVWEEWREARDSHRRASSQAQALERRLIEAREQAGIAEAEFQAGRAAMQSAQDRRVARQRTLGTLRLELSEAEHRLQLAEERAANREAAAEAARRLEAEGKTQAEAAQALRRQLAGEVGEAETALAAVNAPTDSPEPDTNSAQEARRSAEHARRAASAAASSLAALRTRREFLEEQATQLERAASAAQLIPAAEAVVAEGQAEVQSASEAAQLMARLRAELEGIDSLRPGSASGTRLVEVITPRPGFKVALAAVLGPLSDAMAVKDEGSAVQAVSESDQQVTALYPSSAPAVLWDSLYNHVDVADGYDLIARRLLGQVVVGRDVTLDGVYREPGLVRAGTDMNAALHVRRAELHRRIEELQMEAAGLEGATRRLQDGQSRLAGLRAAAAGVLRADETIRLLQVARESESSEAEKLAVAERAAAEAEDRAAAVHNELELRIRELAEQKAAIQQREMWRDRLESLRRQVASVEDDISTLLRAVEERQANVAHAEASAGAAAEALPDLRISAQAARDALSAAEHDAPEDEAKIAEMARKLVALEEARIDARLRVGNLEGNLGLIVREAELLQARMEEIRSRMPDGVAPEEVPGGKAREREMKALERRLEEIGPTNALAESECRELEERYETLAGQLEDISAARADLATLIDKLREEEESRYEAVFGAVAANFNEYFAELNPGGRATLRHAEGDDGPRTGVEILVQPPRKRLQNVTLLSSGERSLAALALVLALDEVNPSPFTILDEVDAALDDANVDRFGQMVARLGASRQFLVITHNHVTMSYASTLYGIHLDESGSSHIVSVRLDDIRKPATRRASTAQAG
jgi:chromosome segregation protein